MIWIILGVFDMYYFIPLIFVSDAQIIKVTPVSFGKLSDPAGYSVFRTK